MMRISTSQIYQKGIDLIVDHQAKLATSENHLAAGKRVLSPSDDPAAAGALTSIQAQLTAQEQFGQNITMARARLSEEENVLAQVGESLQRFNELILQAGSAALHDADRDAIAVELTSLREQILSLANTRSASGDYLFSGGRADTVPFSESSNVVSYQGDETQREMLVGENLRIGASDTGYHVFQDIRNGNGVFSATPSTSNSGTLVITPELSGNFVPDNYTVTFSTPTPGSTTYAITDGGGATIASGSFNEGDSLTWNGITLTTRGTPADGDVVAVAPAARRDLFSTLQLGIDAVADHIGGVSSSAVLGNALNETMMGLESSMDHLLAVRAGVGARLGTLDARESMLADQELVLEQTRSSLEDLDLVGAVNELNLQRVALQAAQQAYLQIRDLSIFRYL